MAKESKEKGRFYYSERKNQDARINRALFVCLAICSVVIASIVIISSNHVTDHALITCLIMH